MLPNRRAPCSGMCWRTNWRISCEEICGRTGCFFWRGHFTGSIPWRGGRSGRCRPNAKRPATNWHSRPWVRPIGLHMPPRIIELATNLAPSGLAPAMIGLISSIRRLTSRVERLERSGSVTSLRAPLIGGIVLGIGLMGLTDAMPAATRIQAVAKSATVLEERGTARRQDRHDSRSLRGSNRQFGAGRCDRAVIQGRRTYRAHCRDCKNNQRRRRSIRVPPVSPRRDLMNRSIRSIYLVFAEAHGSPDRRGWNLDRGGTTISTTLQFGFFAKRRRSQAPCSAQAAARSRVPPWRSGPSTAGRFRGILSATTGPDGRFLINRIPHYDWMRRARPIDVA